MDNQEPKRLSSETPLILQKEVDEIPPGGKAYLTAEDVKRINQQNNRGIYSR